ncbi:hypothetical protein ACFX14_026453 [Malus domestica]
MNLWVMEDHDKKVWSKRQALNINLEVLGDLEATDSICNVVRLEDRQPDEIFKVQSDFEKVNLKGPWRWQDFSFIFFLFAFAMFSYGLCFVLGL